VNSVDIASSMFVKLQPKIVQYKYNHGYICTVYL